jgi:SAM-dependent methyltransferase
MYDADLAYIQHHGFGEFARRIGPGILAELRRAGITRGRVLDLGCGDGTWMRTLVENGYAVEGIDQSKDLVRYATRAVRSAVVTVGSLYAAPFPPCDAMTAMGEVLSYRPNPKGTPPSLDRVFRRASAALRPGGVLIFDVLIDGQPMNYETWRAGPTWAVLTRVSEAPRHHWLTREIVTFRKTRGGYRRRGETHVLRSFGRQALVSELRRVGFRVQARNRYGHVRLPFRRWAFVARKPTAG